jgi:type III pantothenate kinase
VNEGMLARVVAALDVAGAVPLTRFTAGDGRAAGQVRIPIAVELVGPVTTGVDRLLNALAAFSRSGGQPCVVIDAGTAVTVDFIDRHGVFQGGVIAPGVSMMLGAMHTGTSALPAVASPRSREDVPAGPLGKNTVDAMTLGALNAVRGLAHVQIDAFAETAGRYPRVVATGGDAPILFENDPLVEHIVPDLPLMGMLAAWQIVSGSTEPAGAAVEEGADEDADDDAGED